ncbi:hypothetical protein [Halorubrum sp. BOL3-1]|uniref:hypothetical protein n=1 Tax=Halorubrum sp. BOL3-1 TaxID=2497325 RepID=UPI00140A3AA3|nr:hypothetical protein [Halorubrum sp. BOL3-1]
MDPIGVVALAWRLGVAAVAVGGPTVLYLGLWRFLAWLRDDTLIDRLAARGAVEAPDSAPADVIAAATEGLDGRRCPDCGTTVCAGATRCRRCHRALDGAHPVDDESGPEAGDALDGRR